MSGGGAQYAAAEALNATPLQQVTTVINESVVALTGRPLFGDGVNGGAGGSGGLGGAGGLLVGQPGANGPP